MSKDFITFMLPTNPIRTPCFECLFEKRKKNECRPFHPLAGHNSVNLHIIKVCSYRITVDSTIEGPLKLFTSNGPNAQLITAEPFMEASMLMRYISADILVFIF
jgi:hypothetical protein